MDNTTFYLVALLMATVSAWGLVSGAAVGVGWRIGPVRCTVLAASISLALLSSVSAAAQSPPPTRAGAPRSLQLENKPWTGDLKGMIERRKIRFLIPHSRTLYFTDKGQETTYVRNIFKYYVSYELVRRAQEEQRRARERHGATG